MAKRSRPTEPLPHAPTAPPDEAKARKRRKRLQRELAELERLEARRLEQLETIRAAAADVRRRVVALDLLAVEDASTDPAAATADPAGYCLRERRRVRIVDPAPVTLSNGRRAIAGTCATCGAKVVVLSARAASSDA